MRVVCRIRGNVGTRHALHVRERGVIPLPDPLAFGLDFVEMLKLRPEECRDDLRRQERTARIDPAILVHFAAKELGAIRPLFPDDLSAADEAFVVDDEHTALARDDVLRLVEGERRQMPDRPERTTLVERIDRLRGIFDDQQSVPIRNLHNRVHVTGDARIVDGHDDLRARRHERLDEVRVDIRLVRPAVGEHDLRPLPNERQRRRNERVGRHDHLVARPDPRENRRHLQRVRAGRREQTLAEAIPLLEEFLAPCGEHPVAGNLATENGLVDVVEFLARLVRAIEVNHLTNSS